MIYKQEIFGFQITTDPDFQNVRLGIPSELALQFEELYYESQNKKDKGIVAKLINLISKYPQFPQLKNYLAVAYQVKGNYQKSAEINNLINTQHPDYLFGKINTALNFIASGQPDKVPGLLGDGMDLQQLYPERALFHLAEVTSFYKAVIHYYVATKNIELSETNLRLLSAVAPNHPDTESCEELLVPLRMERSLQRWKENNESRISVKCLKPVLVSMQLAPPAFNHPEINNLYLFGLRIPPEKLREILALPRNTLVADLQKILQDAVDRYQYFLEEDYDETMDCFPLHAICLLGDLMSENSLPFILDFLENEEAVLEFWLGDHRTATIWLPLYLISQNNTELLKEFLLKPGIATYSKTVVTETLAQIAFHQPERGKEIAAIFSGVLSGFIHAELQDNLIDSDFLALAISDMIDCGFEELLPLIKELYGKGYVSLEVNGPYEDVVQFFKNRSSIKRKKKIKNIFELYEEIVTHWAGYLEDEADELFDDDDLGNDFIQVPAVSNKIGRNELCPCGSGKKYKKCCLDTLPF